MRQQNLGSENTCYRTFTDSEGVAAGLWKTRLAARLTDELTPAIIARFHAKYEKSAEGCWLWKSACYHNGYGQFMVCRIGGRQLNIQAHRHHKGHHTLGRIVKATAVILWSSAAIHNVWVSR